MPRKASKKPQPPKLPKGEAEQVRIRREIGHDFALKPDAFGRQRLTPGTAEARRVYEVSNDGYTSTGGIVRLRNVDPLKGITSLTRQQREAGGRFRDDFERSQREGLQPPQRRLARVRAHDEVRDVREPRGPPAVLGRRGDFEPVLHFGHRTDDAAVPPGRKGRGRRRSVARAAGESAKRARSPGARRRG